MIRTIDGKGAEPEEGDKIICLQNSWDYLDDDFNGALVNGTIGYLKNPQKKILKPNIPFLPREIEILEGRKYKYIC